MFLNQSLTKTRWHYEMHVQSNQVGIPVFMGVEGGIKPPPWNSKISAKNLFS